MAEFADLRDKRKLHQLGEGVSFIISGDKTVGYQVIAQFWRFYPNPWTINGIGKTPEQLVDNIVRQYRLKAPTDG